MFAAGAIAFSFGLATLNPALIGGGLIATGKGFNNLDR